MAYRKYSRDYVSHESAAKAARRGVWRGEFVGGLDPGVQKALDAVRVIGNNAVHPGQIALRDDRATAAMLFGLLNIIAEKLISVLRDMDVL